MSQGLVNDRAVLAENVHDINSTNTDQQLASMASTSPSRTINHSRAEVDAGTGGGGGGIACDNQSFLKCWAVYRSNSWNAPQSGATTVSGKMLPNECHPNNHTYA